MSRIRTVKPEFWSHPKVTAVSRDARLLFLGMLNEVDDEGRLHYIPKRLAGVVFPEDDDVDGPQVDRWADELEAIGLVCRYEVDAARLLQVIGFSDHQVINRPTPSRLPACLSEHSLSPPAPLTEGSVGEGKGREGNGSAPKGARALTTALDAEFTAWWDKYPRKVSKQKALKAFTARRREGVALDDLTRARDTYASSRVGEDQKFTQHAATFLGRDGPWVEWLAGNPDGVRVDPDEWADRLARGET